MAKSKKVLLVIFPIIAIALNVSLYYWNQSLKASEVPYLANTPLDRVTFDGQEQVWVYGDYQLSVYKDGKLVQVFTEKDSPVLERTIQGMEVDNKGRIWIISQVSVSIFDGMKWSTLLPKTDYLPAAMSMLAIDSQGRAWIGTEYQGFYIVDGENWENYTVDNSDLLNNNVNCIVFDNQGRAWIGTEGETQVSGINIFDGNVWQTFSYENSPLRETAGANYGEVRAIAFDQQGRAWIASYFGLQVFDGDKWIEYPNTFRFSDIAVDGLGRVWVNSNEGLVVFNGDVREYYFDPFNYAGFADFIQNSGIEPTYGGSYFFGRMTTDNDGNIWIPTKKGVVVIPPDSPQPISYAAGILSIFITTNGLIYLTVLLLVAWLCIALNLWRTIGFSLLGFPIYLFWINSLNDLSYIELWFFNRDLPNFYNNPGCIGTIGGIIGGCVDILLARSGKTKRTWWGLAGFVVGAVLSSLPLLLSGVT